MNGAIYLHVHSAFLCSFVRYEILLISICYVCVCVCARVCVCAYVCGQHVMLCGEFLLSLGAFLHTFHIILYILAYFRY